MFAVLRHHHEDTGRVINRLGMFAVLIGKGVHGHIFGTRNILLQGVKHIPGSHQIRMGSQGGKGANQSVGDVPLEAFAVLVESEVRVNQALRIHLVDQLEPFLVARLHDFRHIGGG
ncbi:hypothetical protein D3C76_1265260 [compost metagenome]